MKVGHSGKDSMRANAQKKLGIKPISKPKVTSDSRKAVKGRAKGCYAAGGVAKVRHGEATASGKPMKPKTGPKPKGI